MTKTSTQSDNVAAMASELEELLAAFDAGPSVATVGYRKDFERREIAGGMIIAHVERRGGRASDRFDAARISFADIKVSCTAGMIQCARNWCRKARASIGAAT